MVESTPERPVEDNDASISLWDRNAMAAFGCTLNQGRLFAVLAVLLAVFGLLQLDDPSPFTANYWRLLTYGFAAAFAWSSLGGTMERVERNIFFVLAVLLAYHATGQGLLSFNLSFAGF